MPSDTVLVVGAGNAALIPDLVRDGYEHLIVNDLAAAALNRLVVRLDGDARALTLLPGDVRTLTVDEPVSVWHDRATFHFLVDTDDQTAYAATAGQAVRPGGHLVLAGFAPDGPAQCSGLDVARHSVDSLVEVFGAYFDLIESFEQTHTTPWGSDQLFLHAVMRRRDQQQSA
jgi:SAM-dependent methyltransferase